MSLSPRIAVPEVGRRRNLHPQASTVEDKNKDQQQCYKCWKVISDKENIEQEELDKEPGNRHRRRRKYSTPSELSRQNLCKDCSILAGNDASVSNYNITDIFTTNRASTLGLIKKLLLVLGLIIILGTVAIYFFPTVYKLIVSEKTIKVKVHNQTQNEIDFDNELYGLEDIYKQQDERVWYTFAAGIKAVIAENPNKPSVFLLLFDSVEAEKTTKCLVKDITKAATKYIMNREIEPLMLAGRTLNEERILNDPGELLVKYKDPLANQGAMVITNLEDVNPKVAASFHFFCDRYSPLVEKAILLFTLRLNGVPKAPLQKAAEETLQNLWAKDLQDNILFPLITRLTGNVLKISNDYSGC